MTTGADAAPSSRRALWLTLAVSLCSSLAFVWRSGFEVDGERYFSLFDDGMISLTYARTLAEGHGLVWFPGADQVEGYTNLAWTLWMALLHLVPVPTAKVSLLVMLSGVGVLLADLVVVRAIARRVLSGLPHAAALAVWLVALSYPLVYWTLRGMEVGLVALLISCAVLLALRLRDRFSAGDVALLALVMVLGALTRTDAIAPLGLVALFAAWQPARGRVVVAATGIGGLAAAFAGHTLFRIAYYDEALPNTYYLKLGGVELGERLTRGVAALGYSTALQLWAGLAFAVLLLVLHRRPDPAVWLLAAVFAVQAAYSMYVGGDAWEWMGYSNRYLATGLPVLMTLAAGGIAAVVAAPRPLQHRAAAALAVVASVVVALQLRQTWLPLRLLQAEPRSAGLAVVATVLVPLVVVAATRIRWSPGPAAALLAAAVVLAANGQAFGEWVSTGGAAVPDDARMARYALALRDSTEPDAVIAVVWAGALPYFSERPAVDLLGKSDPVIAHLPPRDVPLRPGHTKWDYDYSILALQPDVVAQVYSPGGGVLEEIAAGGYRRVAHRVFVREGSTRADAAALERALRGDWHATVVADAPARR
ncbi:MAG: hypothetical protein WD232_03960 [Acidimicrobiales bacterium]